MKRNNSKKKKINHFTKRRKVIIGRGRAILSWKEREIMVGRVREGKDVIWRSRNGKKRGENCE